MSADQLRLLGTVLAVTLLAGVADAQGFIHAARIWQDGKLILGELWKSALGFFFGITMYWLSLRYMKGLGIVTPEIQTLIWFGVTIVGVAVVSGKVLRWPLIEQAVAAGVLLGIGWLLFRTGG